MFRNYLKVALRSLWKNPGLSALNIAGLAIGMTCSLLIFIFVKDELSYDRYHQDSENIYRVVKDFVNDDGTRIPDATTQPPLATAMQRELPEVVSITRLHPSWGGSTIVKYKDIENTEGGIWRVDSSFFDVFTVPFIKGNPKTALSDRNNIIVTESAARRYFGNEDPIGKTLSFLGSTDNITITAVIQDVPPQSHLHYDFLMSWHRLPKRIENAWSSYNYYTYVKVQPGTDMKAFDKKIQVIYEKNDPDKFSAYYTQPLTGIHLDSHLKWELGQNGDRIYSKIFSIIGIFILLIASINYINLSTAKSSLRAKETGIRKVSGALRASLVLQFLLESVILCLIAYGLALGLSYTINPLFNELTQKNLQVLEDLSAIFYLGLASIGVGLLAGIFPALYLSSFKPVAVMKGLHENRGTFNLRKSLVVVQFTISIVLIISTLIIARQMNYLRSAKLGFEKEQIVIVKNGRYLKRGEATHFLNELKQLSGVQAAASSGDVIGGGFSTTRLRARGSQQTQQLNYAQVNDEYLELAGVEFLEGRGFSAQFPVDSMNNGILGGPMDQTLGGIVINERAVRDFGLGTPAVGKQLVWTTDADTTYYVDVIGVVKDFHFTSLRNEIKPFGFIWRPDGQFLFSAKISGSDIPVVLKAIETTWTKSFPDIPFQYNFMDETFSRMYNEEIRFQQLFIILVALGVVIACLGLFALAAFAAERRIKEIGIRKVLGASVLELLTLLSKDFVKLVTIALVLAIPIAIFAMQTWLKGFAYRVSIEWWIIVASAAITLFIALATTIAQAIKAATADPVKGLRSE